MKGTRPLDNSEIRAIFDSFTGEFEKRDRGLFLLGVSVGGRISEMLGLRVGDVWQNNAPVTDLLFHKSIVKGKEVSRTVPVNSDGRGAIVELMDYHLERFGRVSAGRWLFPSRLSKGDKPLHRQSAHNALKRAFVAAGLNGKLATHSLRKSFAQRLYEATEDIYSVQEMLGHKNVMTTQRYIGVNYGKVREAVESMVAIPGTERDIRCILSSSQTMDTEKISV
ncbi:site-specific integrase [Candidatus Poribacteria bacterium]|nr:site-specific integrase [Candidatus Poribacteria bacterium]